MITPHIYKQQNAQLAVVSYNKEYTVIHTIKLIMHFKKLIKYQKKLNINIVFDFEQNINIGET